MNARTTHGDQRHAPEAQKDETMKTTTTKPEQLTLTAPASSYQQTRAYSGLQITAQLAQIRESTATKAQKPSDISAIFDDLRTLAQEAFCVLTLDAKNNVIARHLVTLGIVDASLVHPREVFRPAIMDGAAALVCVHNHPSGDPSPSAEDLKITRQLVEAGRIIDIKIIDHVIIGRPSPNRTGEPYLSLREAGLVAF